VPVFVTAATQSADCIAASMSRSCALEVLAADP
jgi:hypothetical protein